MTKANLTLFEGLTLPVLQVLDALAQALAAHGAVVLEAPPGAGKSTVVPLALLRADGLLAGRILMLEPRRLAARAVATRMAALLGEQAGETVGYRTRHDSRVGKTTRIEVVTEGILTRLLQADPALEGVALVIFDEFHERSLQGDLGLTLVRDVQHGLREDLKVLMMSATFNGQAVAAFLGDAPIVRAEGRQYPVAQHYLGGARRYQDDEVVQALQQIIVETEGDVLVFLPGGGEIRRVHERLSAMPLFKSCAVHALYGELDRAAQDAAIRPNPTQRKIVLATNIAETSLTIEGVSVVLDSGWARVARFHPGSGLTRLDTVRVSKDSADQRCGRAGRLGPGQCYRLWGQDVQQGLVPARAPEITEADLTSLALELARWGTPDPASLNWLDAPPRGAYEQATQLLVQLGALEAVPSQTTDEVSLRLTPHGEAMSGLGTHPRLAHMLLRGKDGGQGATACLLAALLDERDLLSLQDAGADISVRVHALSESTRDRNVRLDRNRVQRVMQNAKRWRQQLGIQTDVIDETHTGALLALAYPDRVAKQRQKDSVRYQLANGAGAVLDESDPLRSYDFLVVADMDRGQGDGRIYRAAPISMDTIEAMLSDVMTQNQQAGWSDTDEAVVAYRETRLGALVLARQVQQDIPPELRAAGLCEGLRKRGLAALRLPEEAQVLRARVALMRGLEGDAWPDMGDAPLLESLEDWLGPYTNKCTCLDDLARLDLVAALRSLLDWKQQQYIDAQLPMRLTLGNGRQVRVDYLAEDGPVISGKVQDFFGVAETPALANGRVSVLVEMLSPARRPVQRTRDLAGFWKGSYAEVRKEMKGRYPKHPWPDDPMARD